MFALSTDIYIQVSTLLKQGADQLGISLDAYQHDQLVNYLALMVKWNAVYNLTAIRHPLDMVKHHLLDAMTVLPLLISVCPKKPVAVLDVGTGAGLPGMVLAILQPTWSIVLIDAVHKKTAFLLQAIAQLKLSNVQVLHGRVECLKNVDGQPQGFDVIISRAFSSQRLFVKWAGHLVHSQGLMVAMKGKIETDPGDDLPPPWRRQKIHAMTVPGLAAKRHLIMIKQDQQG